MRHLKTISPGFPGARVLVAVETETGWGRAIVRGVHRELRRHPGWSLRVERGGVSALGAIGEFCDVGGVIARVHDGASASVLKQSGLPVVNVSATRVPEAKFPRVASDPEAAALMAAEYFRRRGYRSFGYVSFLRADYVLRQRLAFARALGGHGFCCAQLAVDQWGASASSTFRPRLATWLRELPKPAAIFTWSGGTEILDACREASIPVPEEIALLSGSDDDLLCEVCDVPISAVRQPAEEVGARAMALLREWMNEARRPRAAEWIAPTEIITRRSTDTLAVEDAVVARATRLVRAKFATPIGVDDLAMAAGVSRRVLERRFHAVLEQSPGGYLRAERLQAARVMLKSTSLPVFQVAEACGFRSPEYLVQAFRAAEGVSPTGFRRQGSRSKGYGRMKRS